MRRRVPWQGPRQGRTTLSAKEMVYSRRSARKGAPNIPGWWNGRALGGRALGEGEGQDKQDEHDPSVQLAWEDTYQILRKLLLHPLLEIGKRRHGGKKGQRLQVVVVGGMLCSLSTTTESVPTGNDPNTTDLPLPSETSAPKSTPVRRRSAPLRCAPKVASGSRLSRLRRRGLVQWR